MFSAPGPISMIQRDVQPSNMANQSQKGIVTNLTYRLRCDILWVRKRKWPRRCWSTSGPGPQRKDATVDEASLAHDPARSPEEQPYRYPNAVELARMRASKEPSPAARGLIGGLVTLNRYGRQHYVRMIRLSRTSRS